MMEEYAQVAVGSSAPWWVTLLLVALPGILAIAFTIGSTVVVRRINRADKPDRPFSVMKSVLWTLGLGAFWGPLLQFGLQELISELSATAHNWKLIVLSPFITGIASIIAYDILRAYTKNRYPGAYALLSVKHSLPGNPEDGDLTKIYVAQGDDLTTPPRRP